MDFIIISIQSICTQRYFQSHAVSLEVADVDVLYFPNDTTWIFGYCEQTPSRLSFVYNYVYIILHVKNNHMRKKLNFHCFHTLLYLSICFTRDCLPATF